MRLLLVTQSWLWMQESPGRLRPEARTAIVDEDNELFLSAASSWEIAIKYALARSRCPNAPADYVPSRMRSSGVLPLPISHTPCTSRTCRPTTMTLLIGC